MPNRQGRREGSIDPSDGPLAVFALGLRDLRSRCGGPTYRELATWTRKIHSPYSDTALSSAARGQELPSWDVTSAYVRACLAYAKTEARETENTVKEWEARWRDLKAQLAPEPAAAITGSVAEPEEERPATVAVEPFVRHALPGLKAHWKKAFLGIAAVTAVGALVPVAHYLAAPGSASADPGSISVPESLGPAPSSRLPKEATLSLAADSELEGNYRCGRARFTAGLSWSPCTRVDAQHVVFVVRLRNTGAEPATIKAKLAYVQAAAAHACPGHWGTGVEIVLRPGRAVTSPLDECVVNKTPAAAFQAKAWVTTGDQSSWGYREMSPTVHVQPDGRTAIWADDA